MLEFTNFQFSRYFIVFELLHKILSLEFADTLQAVSPNHDEDVCQFLEKTKESFSRYSDVAPPREKGASGAPKSDSLLEHD